MPDQQVPKYLPTTSDAALPFLTLWYRFVFFDWMFRDISATRNMYERAAAVRHNRYMCRYLPVYLRRWACLGATSYALGCMFELNTGATLLAAWCFIWSCLALTGMAVIGVAWAFLARR